MEFGHPSIISLSAFLMTQLPLLEYILFEELMEIVVKPSQYQKIHLPMER